MRSDYYSKLGGKSTVKPESLGPPQMPLQNTQKGSMTLFKVGAEMIYHLNNEDGKC